MNDPVMQILAPFLPMALLVAATVAFLRAQLLKLRVNVDGWAVIGLSAVLSVLVCVWMQHRAGAALDWQKVAFDAPAVLLLASGGTAYLKKIRAAAQKLDVGEIPAKVDVVVDGQVLASAVADAEARAGAMSVDLTP